jgi:hypothetical protein
VVYSGAVHLDELRALARDWRVAAVLAKPFSPTDLLAAVRGAIQPRAASGRTPTDSRWPTHGATEGSIEFLSLRPPRLQVAGSVFRVPDPALLHGVKLGDRVAVSWERAGAVLRAIRITFHDGDRPGRTMR